LFCGGLASGDSAPQDSKQRLTGFKERLNRMIEGDELPFTVVLDDPTGNSYLQVHENRLSCS
jgi:C4-type Zn-finger protein